MKITPPHKKTSVHTSIILPTKLSQSWKLIESDYYRYFERIPTKLQAVKAALSHTSFRINFWLRLSACKGLHNHITVRILRHFSEKCGISIPPQTKIGYGFYIGHAVGIIINPTAVIGNNVNISQHVTIGSNRGQAAYVGDNVYIGPNVCLVENVVIGDGAKLGAGAVVVKNIPERATAVGVPARVVKINQDINHWHEYPVSQV